MRIIRYIALLLSFLLLPSVSLGAENLEPVTSYPDLLSDSLDETPGDDYLDEPQEFVVYDPLEPVNRVFFVFNDRLYEWILKPVTDGYIWVVPRGMREGFGNFFYNLAAPVRFLNFLLQGEFKQSGIVLERFLINSTIGVYGLADIAAIEFDLQPKRADLGQTMGKWGVGSGIYLCWPLVGPSNIRDSVGLVGDAYAHPIPYFHNDTTLDIAYYISNRLNTISLNPDRYDEMKRYALDPYVASRQAYSEYRKALIDR